MNKLLIRNEQEKDYRAVEEATREAFWNLYVPGCDEHYLVHLMRDSPDFLPELAFVAVLNEKVVGSIFFTKSHILDENGMRHDTITFGPVSVLPELHRQGIGSALIEHGRQAAIQRGYRAILIYGYPEYYKRFGFRHAKDFGISNPDGKYPLAHLSLELFEGALQGISGRAFESGVYDIDKNAAQEYDALFEAKIKLVTPSQKIFAETAAAFL